MGGKAILVLERPWWTPYENPRRASVLPFLQGMANYLENFTVYHSSFYERESFALALQDNLTLTREKRLYLYIASHGNGRMLGGSGANRGLQLSTLLSHLDEAAGTSNIEGVVIGSCEIGRNVDDLQELLVGNNIVWLFGYTCGIDWMGSTLVDLSLFESLTRLQEADLRDRDRILSAFSRGLKKFDGNYPVGEDDEGQVALRDAITLVIQPRGRGNVPREDTQLLRMRLGWG